MLLFSKRPESANSESITLSKLFFIELSHRDDVTVDTEALPLNKKRKPPKKTSPVSINTRAPRVRTLSKKALGIPV